MSEPKTPIHARHKPRKRLPGALRPLIERYRRQGYCALSRGPDGQLAPAYRDDQIETVLDRLDRDADIPRIHPS